MHRDLSNRGRPVERERGLRSQRYVAELHERGLTLDAAADLVCQVFGVPRGAARLYVRSHPAWASEVPAEGPRRARAFRS